MERRSEMDRLRYDREMAQYEASLPSPSDNNMVTTSDNMATTPPPF